MKNILRLLKSELIRLKDKVYSSLPVVFKEDKFLFSGFDIKELETLV